MTSNPLLSFLERAGLYLTVAVTGAAVMVIELLGTRLIAPFYGASLYVWSALISVTMIALATGYFTGGRWADRAKHGGLYTIIALAGLLTLAIPWLTRPVLLATDPLGLRLGAFTSALVLFFPSLTLLGMVGPFAIKLATAQLERLGASVGSMYAVSTVGSVLGTLILGFFLFPLVGSREILLATGLILLGLAAAVAWYERRYVGQKIAVLPCLVLSLLGLGIFVQARDAGQGALHQDKFELRAERESLYGWVRVVDQPGRDLRLLMSDASTIGAASIKTGANQLTYQDIVQLFPALAATPIRRALLIGQGAGHMAMGLRDRYGIVTDTLEIDPAVAEAASEYFGFTPTGQQIIGDGRYVIRHLTGPYDLIIHDCFTGGAEPAHLLTVETLTQLRQLLAARGLLALNFVAFARDEANAPHPALASVGRTLGEVFPHHQVFISDPGRDFNDFIFLASNQPIDLASPPLTGQAVNWLRTRQFPLDESSGVILTDNFNPLEHLQIRKAEHYRRMLVDWVGVDLLMR